MYYYFSYQEKIEIGFLVKAPDFKVVEWLEKNWKQPEDGPYGDQWGFEHEGRWVLERLLTKRKDEFIDYGLARYGFSLKAIQTVFDRGNTSTRYAAIVNPRGNIRLKQAGEIIRKGSFSLLRAMLQSRYLTSDFLVKLLYRKDGFEDISDNRLYFILRCLSGNERLSREYDALYMNGFDDFEYHKTFQAAWDLTKTVPADQKWASVLWAFLGTCIRPSSLNGIEQAIDRWRIDEPKKKDEPVWVGLPSHIERQRRLAEEGTRWYERNQSFNVRSLLGACRDNGF